MVLKTSSCGVGRCNSSSFSTMSKLQPTLALKSPHTNILPFNDYNFWFHIKGYILDCCTFLLFGSYNFCVSPLTANLSASSFPGMPLYAGTWFHCITILSLLTNSKSSSHSCLFLTASPLEFLHPFLTHCCDHCVTPNSTYLLSE